VERLLIWLLCGLAACSIDVRAADNGDGFVWVDANTKIRIKPIGSAAAGGTTAGKAAAAEATEPAKKETRKEKPKK
jgi:hypothetical protein